ncbi:MAG: Tim44 domain-containing protein [Nitrospinae bacterium]|nr:Tim44 domain-containing protein [Nitrospinota bacterium]
MRKINALFLAAVLFSTIVVLTASVAEARVGGGRSSMGSRGSRSYSQPSAPIQRQTTPPPQSTPQRQVQPVQPAPQPMPQPQPAGGFMRSFGGGLLGGIAGGMLGGMLFRSMGWGGEGAGGMGGSGIGIFEIILIAGIAYLIYRMVSSSRKTATEPSYQPPSDQQFQSADYQSSSDPVSDGIAYIRRMDAGFDEAKFNDAAMDVFFKVQGAWMSKNLATADALITDELKRTIQDDINALNSVRHTNRLENIAVRKVEITEAWQEEGQDYITALFTANLLDYTTDDATGAVVAGSKTEPVKFEEYWTFTRKVGPNPWRLSAITQR